MVDYSRWDNLDTGSDSDGDDAAQQKAAVRTTLQECRAGRQERAHELARPLSGLYEVRRSAGGLIVALAPHGAAGAAADGAPLHARSALAAAEQELARARAEGATATIVVETYAASVGASKVYPRTVRTSPAPVLTSRYAPT